jgi:hypothetical protein
MSAAYIDCALPKETDEVVNQQGEVEIGCKRVLSLYLLQVNNNSIARPFLVLAIYCANAYSNGNCIRHEAPCIRYHHRLGS